MSGSYLGTDVRAFFAAKSGYVHFGVSGGSGMTGEIEILNNCEVQQSDGDPL